MSLRKDLRAAVEAGDEAAVDRLIEDEARGLRYLVSMTYMADARLRRAAALAIGRAASWHKRTVKSIILRYLKAMDDQGASDGRLAPEALTAIAEIRPRLLLPLVPELTRLAGEPSLHDGLTDTLDTLRDQCPGEVGGTITRSLNDRFERSRKRKKQLEKQLEKRRRRDR